MNVLSVEEGNRLMENLEDRIICALRFTSFGEYSKFLILWFLVLCDPGKWRQGSDVSMFGREKNKTVATCEEVVFKEKQELLSSEEGGSEGKAPWM